MFTLPTLTTHVPFLYVMKIPPGHSYDEAALVSLHHGKVAGQVIDLIVCLGYTLLHDGYKALDLSQGCARFQFVIMLP